MDNKIKKWRVLKGLTQESVGKALGLKGQNVQKWECNSKTSPHLPETAPPAKHWEKLSKLYGREVEEFYQLTLEVTHQKTNDKSVEPFKKPKKLSI
jgi:transcriptional regulator with XRE-family HTH domain